MKLNRTQVKSVIREIIEAPDIIDTIKIQAGDKSQNPDDSSTTPEVRVTRTYAKKVAQEGGKLWLLDQVNIDGFGAFFLTLSLFEITKFTSK